jgi:hypothetical protein
MQDIRIGDRVQMRKQHPCGSDEWTIERLGADVAVRCAGCNRRVLLPRGTFNKRLKKILTQRETNEGETK